MTKNNDYIEDLKKETSKALSFLEKDKKTTTLVIGWIVIVFGAIGILQFIQFNSYSFFHSNAKWTIFIILSLLSNIFFTYAGYGLLNYKKNIPTTLIISFALSVVASSIYSLGNSILSTLIWKALILYAIYWWVNKNKDLFIK